MSIAAYIREKVLRPRLVQAGCLVVYDPYERYRGLCNKMAEERVRVIDASKNSILSRHDAVLGLAEISKTTREFDALLIYVPQPISETDEAKQIDPFSVFGETGAVFPADDGDDYLSLCLRAKPDHMTAVRRVFEQSDGDPSFSVIDAIGGGINWPQLRSILNVESPGEILFSLLVPDAEQSKALLAEDGWGKEAREFLNATLGMSVKSRAKSWEKLADEVWRFVLFSEFVFDLPCDLPSSLQGVPRAQPEAKPIIEDVCERLRNNRKSRDSYIERAEAIETELDLPSQCRAIKDLGTRDTFPFEERTFLSVAIEGIKSDDIQAARHVLERRKGSVWLGQAESQVQWGLLKAGLSLIEACEDNERQLVQNARSQANLIDFYINSLREVDRLQREFEQSVGEYLDAQDLMHDLIEHARMRYRRLIEKVQSSFVKHLEVESWPPPARLANANVFDEIVAPRLKDSGRRVAYLMIDALRYELGVALEKMLSEDGPVEIKAAFAQMPTITLVGMPSLLPGAGTNLTLQTDGGDLVPLLNGAPIKNVKQRMAVLKTKYGDRFQEMRLSQFARTKAKLSDAVDLLVLRSTEIDSQLENEPETTLSLIPGTLRLIRTALHKLRKMGFHEAVIVTDHGFFLNAQAEAGDVCIKPNGNWPVVAHDRMMLGSGTADAHNAVIDAAKLGMKGDFSKIAIPRSMAPYRSGHLYFHGGASLAEAVVPVLIAKLDTGDAPNEGRVSVILSYRNGATRITTRVPVVELSVHSDDMFSMDEPVEVLIQAQDAKGNVVGEPRPGGEVDPATQMISLLPGQASPIPLRMDPDYEGKFKIKAFNPATMVSYFDLELETDYTV